MIFDAPCVYFIVYETLELPVLGLGINESCFCKITVGLYLIVERAGSLSF